MANKDILTDFINNLKRKGKAKSTIIAYENDINQYLKVLGSKSLIKITESELKLLIKDIQKKFNLSPKSLSRKINSIRTFYRFLIEKKLIKENPAINITHPKFRVKKQRFLIKQEYLALKEQSRSNIKTYRMIELLLQTGIRISELSRLKIRNITINKSSSYILIEKFSNNDERKVPLNNKALEIIKDQLSSIKLSKTSYPVFATKTGRPIEIRNIRSAIDKMILRAKIKNACVNDLRNTFIVYQLNSGFPINKLSSIVGHKNSSTTLKYIELLNKKYKSKSTEKLFEL